MSAFSGICRSLFLKGLDVPLEGSLELSCNGVKHRFGQPGASPFARVDVHSPRFFENAVLGGEIGLGESFMVGEWSSPDLVAVVRFAVRNLAKLERRSGPLRGFTRLADIIRHRLRGNSVQGSRRNIGKHYDLSNDFFHLFLDANMLYSCAYYQQESDSLERAQWQKLDLICRKLRLSPEDHVLEIGTGWGAFAEHAVREYGCRVTTTTISREQYEYARARLAPFGDQVTVLAEDYRHLQGRYSRIVSIEMFEAVGLRYYDTFFNACDQLLKPDGVMLLQTITMNEQSYPVYRKKTDWIQKYIFPGGELASVSEILRSLARVTDLSLFDAEELGTHYARTLAEWQKRFLVAQGEVRSLGFDDRFLRMWEYYLAYCEGAFLERHVGTMQLVLSKTHNRQPLFGEPWRDSTMELRMDGAEPRLTLPAGLR